jgi:hypothetical protein
MLREKILSQVAEIILLSTAVCKLHICSTGFNERWMSASLSSLAAGSILFAGQTLPQNGKRDGLTCVSK